MKTIKVTTEQGKWDVYEVENTLEALQKEVDGLIEVTTLAELDVHGIKLLVNEEGLLKGLDPNVNLYPFFFVGTVLLINTDGEEFTSLTDEQVKFCMKWLIGLPF